jgi:hypothetical protein
MKDRKGEVKNESQYFNFNNFYIQQTVCQNKRETSGKK